MTSRALWRRASGRPVRLTRSVSATSGFGSAALWRDELVFAKFILDYEMKLVALRRMLEWRLELEHDWSLVPGKLGQRLKRTLPPDLWEELASTYVGPDLDDNWAALFRTTTLFSRVAKNVGDALGYTYPSRGRADPVHEARHLHRKQANPFVRCREIRAATMPRKAEVTPCAWCCRGGHEFG
jgi:hypothetical protein